jgi:hypothetical protein
VLLHILVIIVLFILGLGSFIGLATSLANDESGAAPSGLGIFVLVLAGLYFLAAVVPSLALGCRRLHDANLPGALLLLLLIPGVNSIAGLVLGFLPSNPLGARFDADGGVQAAQYGLGQAPVNPNAWGAAPSPYQTPYGQPPQTPYGQAPANPYGQAPQSPYGQPPANPYGQAPTGQAAANPYQQPPAV